MTNHVNLLWTEEYRPKTIEECVLPSVLKKQFLAFLETAKTGEIMNMLFFGPAGAGKTSVAKAFCNELDLDYLFINGSLNGNIDTLRNDITSFASTMSMTGGRKLVIFDEADYLNPNSTQPALRGMIEEFSRNCSFIFTCNDVSRIIQPIRESRLVEFDFTAPKAEHSELALQIFKKCQSILQDKSINYDKKVLAEIIKINFPDYRKTINQLQRYARTFGEINVGILSNIGTEELKNLIPFIKSKKFLDARKWVGEHTELIYGKFYRNLFDVLMPHVKDADNIAALIIILNEHQYKAAFVADAEINVQSCIASIMSEISFK